MAFVVGWHADFSRAIDADGERLVDSKLRVLDPKFAEEKAGGSKCVEPYRFGQVDESQVTAESSN